MKLTITAKCSDCFSANLVGEDLTISGTYDGYVPDWFPNPKQKHFGDYVELAIDIETGKILNWVPPTQEQLVETFKNTDSFKN